jgi:hypothetical protein
VLSNLFIGFGTNILTTAVTGTVNNILVGAGLALLLPGLAMAGVGVYMTTFKDNQ